MEKELMIQKGKSVYFTLYIAGDTQRCRNALSNLKEMCKRDLKRKCRMESIDILKNPDAAKTEQIVAIPTLVRERRTSPKRIIGDLSDVGKVLGALDLCPQT